jgi:arylsulfatase
VAPRPRARQPLGACPPHTPEEGYHLNADLADHAIDFVKDAHASAPDKPFLLYYATGAGHAPHQVEPEWINRYRGVFDDGWERYRDVVFERQLELGLLPAGTELSAHDPDVHAWDSLTDEARRMFARQMETYAGFLSQTDHHLGRVIDFIDEIGRLDNTLVVVLSDNGASAEGGIDGTRNETVFFNMAPERLEDNLEVFEDWGGVDTFPHYSWGWTWAGDTPFRRWKRETYRGGITDPCVVSWPAGIPARGEVRTQYAHATDIMPTVLAALGIDLPESVGNVDQSPVAGVSFAHTFDQPEAASLHTTQYFEMLAHRSIYHDGWKAVCPFPGPSFNEAGAEGRVFGLSRLTAAVLDEIEETGWELYRLTDDPTERHDLADEHPDRLADMIALWWSEAEKYGVLPLAPVEIGRLMESRVGIGPGRDRFVYRPGGSPIPFATTPRPYNRPHTVTASVHIPDGGAEGVLLSHGNRHAGYALFVVDNRLWYVHNYLGLQRFEVMSDDPVPAGQVELGFSFEPTGDPILMQGRGTPGTARLFIDGEQVGEEELPYTVPVMFGVMGLSCGFAAFDTVSPPHYAKPFRFTGDLHELVLDIEGDAITNAEAELIRIFAQQ